MKAMNPVAVACPYLVGDLYFTERAGNPSQSWPGTTWEQITDCFIRAADADHPAGTTGGSWTHTQTVDEIARHSHLLYTQDGGSSQSEGRSVLAPGWSNTWREFGAAITEGGESRPMDITNRFHAAYVWKRTG